MFKKLFFALMAIKIALFCVQPVAAAELSKKGRITKIKELVEDARQLKIEGFSGAFNPSIIADGEGYLLIFRYMPYPWRLWVSHIGIVRLDRDFTPLSQPMLLNTRSDGDLTESQAEDARLFRFEGGIYLCYNDNIKITNPTAAERRDIYIAKLNEVDGKFFLSPPLKCTNKKKYPHHKWQKNWVPFEHEGQLMMGYTVNPHEIVHCKLNSGHCKTVAKSSFSKPSWEWGTLRGGTPPLRVNGGYLAFFHSAREQAHLNKENERLWYYYMSAYFFSDKPPFEIKKMLSYPIIREDFYSEDVVKKVVFPGGFVIDGDKIHIVFGKHDREIWIATISKSKLFGLFVPVR